jgi:penicillin G amidase
MSRLLAAVIALVLSILVALPSSAPAAPETPPDPIGGGNVVPPGNTGHLPASDLVAGQSPNVDDQRDLYWEWGTKDWSFARPGEPLPEGADPRDELGEPYSPRTGVTIYRDGWGVPRIFGDTDADGQFGVGYAMAEDRMFQADVFRHVARGEMAEFLGGQEWFDYDREWRRELYTDEELYELLDEFYSEEEQDLLQAYLDGINAYIDEARADPSKLPSEYAALQILPEHWELHHSLAIFVLQARDAVEGFGQELYNTALLADLTERLGEQEGRAVFDDVRFIRDPGAYTTVPTDEGVFPYPGGGFEGIDAPGVALPDTDADGSGGATSEVQALAARDAMIARTLASVGLGRKMASNAIPVSGDITASGEPILLGGPQLQYLVPGIFYEFEVHSPSQHARGVGFAGTAGVVLIGKSPTHAWSITYGYTDQVDVFLVPLDPAQPATHYLRDGSSRELQTYDTTVLCRTYVPGLAGSDPASAGCDGAPVSSETITVRRVPEYGPIIGEVEVGGAPHAVVRVRGHWMRELANGKPFQHFNRALTIEEFRAAQDDFNIALTINYANAEGDIAFWHVAAAPIRAAGTDVRLPTIGDGSHDWEGFLDLDDVPHVVNPDQGYTVNWNNQVSQGWHNGDSNSWADLQRVDMLARRMEALAARGDVTPDDVWQVNREAAFEDGRWHDFAPLLAEAFEGEAPDGTVEQALAAVAAWDGQRTASGEGDDWTYDDAAVGIFDAFLLQLQRDVLAEPLDEHYALIGPDFAPAFYHLKSALLLRVLRGETAPLEAGYDWLGDRTTGEAIRTAFDAAVTALAEAHEGEPSDWEFAAVLTRYDAVGLASVEPHPFLNRGTYNQLAVVASVAEEPVAEEPPAAEPEAEEPEAEEPAAPAPSSRLPATGGTALLPLLGALLLLGARRFGGRR